MNRLEAPQGKLRREEEINENAMQPTVAPVIAAVVIRRQRKIAAAFRDAGAVSATSAVTPASLGIAEKRPFRQLCGHDVLREADGGRFYYDDASWHALLVKRRRYAFAAVVAGVAAVLIVFALQQTFG